MSQLLEKLIEQAKQLSQEEQLQLINRVAEGLKDTERLAPNPSVKQYSITDFRAIQADSPDGVDPDRLGSAASW